MMDVFNGALTLNQDLLRSLRESPQVVRRGMLVVLLVGLLVGGVNGVRALFSDLNPDRDLAAARTQIEDQLDQVALSNPSPEQREAVRLVSENLDSGFALARDLLTLPTPLPRPISAVTQGVATLVSAPLGYLSGLLFWVVLTHIAARWLGGQGNIQQMLGLGALSVAPHALDALAFIPGVGVALVWVARIWGIVVLIVATSVAHRLDSGRATLAVLLFPIIGGVLLLLGCCALFVLALGAGAR